uniref:Pentatricopeptide repeat-containing protein n=1 Tax=Haemonchus contortus TaxID=6289 RepID=A0A7I4Z0Y1_HAECO
MSASPGLNLGVGFGKIGKRQLDIILGLKMTLFALDLEIRLIYCVSGNACIKKERHFSEGISLQISEYNQFDRESSQYGRVGLQLNLSKMMVTRNALVPDAPLTLNGTNISERQVYLGRKDNMMNDLAQELSRRKRAEWGAFRNIGGVMKKKKIMWLSAYVFDCCPYCFDVRLGNLDSTKAE